MLDMRESKVEQLWKGVLPLAKLKEVDLSYSSLISCPNFSGSPNFKKLNLQGCEFLCEISPSIGCLSELDFLNLSYCPGVETIPDLSGLISLRDLDLFGCDSLKMLHEMPCNLETFNLSSEVMEELPLSFGNLSRLQRVVLECEKLKRLPSTFCKLKSLQDLWLQGRAELDELPKDIGCLSSLKELTVGETSIRELPSSMIYLKELQTLQFPGIGVLKGPLNSVFNWDDPFDSDDDIEWLDPNGSDSDDVADYREVYLDVRYWKMFKCLPKLQLRGRHADNCTAGEVLSSLSFQGCSPQADFEDIVKNALHALRKIKQVGFQLRYPGSEVPKWFNFHSLGNFINVELSPNWLNKSFIGFALCAVVAPGPDHEKYYFAGMFLNCKIKSKDGRLDFRDGECDCKAGHVNVYFTILPFSPHTSCDVKEISFEVELQYDARNCKIEKCGVHLMYAQYIEEVDGSSLVGEDENILSLANVHHNREEVDGPHPKRLKKTSY